MKKADLPKGGVMVAYAYLGNVQAVARLFGVSSEVITKLLREEGVKIKKRGRPRKSPEGLKPTPRMDLAAPIMDILVDGMMGTREIWRELQGKYIKKPSLEAVQLILGYMEAEGDIVWSRKHSRWAISPFYKAKERKKWETEKDNSMKSMQEM